MVTLRKTLMVLASLAILLGIILGASGSKTGITYIQAGTLLLLAIFITGFFRVPKASRGTPFEMKNVSTRVRFILK